MLIWSVSLWSMLAGKCSPVTPFPLSVQIICIITTWSNLDVINNSKIRLSAEYLIIRPSLLPGPDSRPITPPWSLAIISLTLLIRLHTVLNTVLVDWVHNVGVICKLITSCHHPSLLRYVYLDNSCWNIKPDWVLSSLHMWLVMWQCLSFCSSFN